MDQRRLDAACAMMDGMLPERASLRADAAAEYHVQAKAKDENGVEKSVAVNVNASVLSEAERKAKAKIEALGYTFVRFLSLRAGPHAVSGS